VRTFPESGIGIVATVPAADGIDIMGSAICVTGNNSTTCEFATTAASEYGGVGLASTLMTTLIDAAKAPGIRQMDGFVLSVNQPMLRLASRLGFSITPDPEDRAVRICRLHLGSA